MPVTGFVCLSVDLQSSPFVRTQSFLENMVLKSYKFLHPSQDRFVKSKKDDKTFPVRVTTLDAVLEFDCESKSTRRNLFELVCRILGIREVWYFGLQYTDSQGFVTWLKLDKKVLHPSVGWEMPVSFVFLVRFYPENIAQDIIQEVTLHLFFLQVKHAVLNADIFCPPEVSVLLASYSLQAMHGDFCEDSYSRTDLAITDLLPRSVVNQFSLTPEMWMQRIKVWYSDHQGMVRGEAETEYLKIASDLRMFGVNYFMITDREGKSQKWLGVTSSGLHIYERNNKLAPNITLKWKDLQRVSFRDRKLVIDLLSRRLPSFQFYVSSAKVSQLVFDLCIGNHDIFNRKQASDSMEVQQMKVQAREEKEKLQTERSKVIREKQVRMKIEKEKAELEQKVKRYQEKATFALNALRRCEIFAELLAEKAQVTSKEARLLTAKVFEVETKALRAEMTALTSEIEKNIAQRKARITEALVSKTAEESKMFAEFLMDELIKENEEIGSYCPNCRTARNLATDALREPFREQISNIHPLRKHNALPDDVTSSEVERLKAEILEEKLNYSVRSEQLSKRLNELKSELEFLKVEEQTFH